MPTSNFRRIDLDLIEPRFGFGRYGAPKTSAGDGDGMMPHNFYSGGPNLDISRFEGTPEQLRANWV